jgi:hypothetical protein
MLPLAVAFRPRPQRQNRIDPGPTTPEPWRYLLDRQDGVLGRNQLLALGMTGPGAVASHGTALWLAGAMDRQPSVIHISYPHPERVKPQPGLTIHRTRGSADSAHPAALPPRSRIEVAVLDHGDATSVDVALDAVLRAIQRRVTTAQRLRRAMLDRSRHRFRTLLLDVLADAEVGVRSPLERHYLREVERPHRLPRGRRNRPELGQNGRSRYRDVRYQKWSTLVELDGREAHPVEEAFRDHRRDNASVVVGDVALRHGWRDIVGNPCGVTADVPRRPRPRPRARAPHVHPPAEPSLASFVVHRCSMLLNRQ